MTKKYVIFKKASGGQVFINKNQVACIESLSDWDQDEFIGEWQVSWFNVSSIDMDDDKTIENIAAIYLIGKSAPILVSCSVMSAIRLLDLEGNYDMEDSIYGP